MFQPSDISTYSQSLRFEGFTCCVESKHFFCCPFVQNLLTVLWKKCPPDLLEFRSAPGPASSKDTTMVAQETRAALCGTGPAQPCAAACCASRLRQREADEHLDGFPCATQKNHAFCCYSKAAMEPVISAFSAGLLLSQFHPVSRRGLLLKQLDHWESTNSSSGLKLREESLLFGQKALQKGAHIVTNTSKPSAPQIKPATTARVRSDLPTQLESFWNQR